MASQLFKIYNSKSHSAQEIADEEIMLEALKEVIDWRFDRQFRRAVARWLIAQTAEIFKDYKEDREEIYDNVWEMVYTLQEFIFPLWIKPDGDGGIWRTFHDKDYQETIRDAFAKTSVGFDTRKYD